MGLAHFTPNEPGGSAVIRRILGLGTLTIALGGPAFAQPTVDGTIAGDTYGGAAAVQAVETGVASELDAAYCTSVGARFYLVLTGNLADDISKIEIFIDSKAGGENVLSGQPGNDGSAAMTGLTFDAGFMPDYHIIVRHGASSFDLDFAELGTVNYSSYTNVFGGTSVGSGLTGTGLNSQPIGVGFDNSNVAGVANGTGAANQAAAIAVQTGVELSIDLADLGYAGGDIRVCAFVNNAAHNFASNQFLGPVPPPQVNLGGDGAGTFTGVINFDLGNFAGDQFFGCSGQRVPVKNETWSGVKTTYR